PGEGLEFEPRAKWEPGNLPVVLAEAARVNQQVACGMLYQDASGGQTERKAAECFRRFDPTSGKTRNRGNHGHGARMRCRTRQCRSPEIEQVYGGSQHRYEREK